MMKTDTKSALGGAGDHAQHGGGGIGVSRYFAGPSDNNGVFGRKEEAGSVVPVAVFLDG